MLIYTEALKNDLRLYCGSTLVVRLAAVPDAVGHQVPECREYGGPNQRFEKRYSEEDGVTRNDEDHHIGDDPDPHQRSNDRPRMPKGSRQPTMNSATKPTKAATNKYMT